MFGSPDDSTVLVAFRVFDSAIDLFRLMCVTREANAGMCDRRAAGGVVIALPDVRCLEA